MTQQVETAASSHTGSTQTEDADYRELCGHLRSTLFTKPAEALFTTSAEGLYDALLAGLPADRRQHYACRRCRQFVEDFGGLVTIDEAGKAMSPLWDDWRLPTFFHEGVDAMSHLVAKARVTGVFLHNAKIWGVGSNRSPKAAGGLWHHMHVLAPDAMLHNGGLLGTTPSQAMAAKREEHGMLARGLAEFPLATVKQAHTLLTNGALYRSEKCEGVATWLLALHETLTATKNRVARENLVWRAVASAPVGFCHVRSTMIGTLLEDVTARKPFDDIKRSFDSKMAPLQYQRPSAAPTDGQLAAAESLVAKLKSAGSLARRYARLEEVVAHAVWIPKAAERRAADPKEAGVFDHLRQEVAAKKTKQIEQPPQTITWEKFARTVLSSAETIDLLVPRTPSSFFAFVTAMDLNAPPILQWDSPENRNPVSWYLHVRGSLGRSWGLDEGTWREVTAVTMQPSSWHHENPHQGAGIYFLLRGARPEPHMSTSLCLFPEHLKSDYHAIRSAIEALSRVGTLEGRAEASACGLCLQKSGAGRGWNEVFRVTSRGTVLTYKIDRWD